MRPLAPYLTARYHRLGYWSRHSWGERLDAWARRGPNRPAAADDHRRLTRGEYVGEIAALSDGLVRIGIEPGDRVAVASGNRVEFAITRLALSEIGAVTVPISVALGPADMVHLVGTSGATALVGVERWGDREVLAPVAAESSGLRAVIAFDDPAPQGMRSLSDIMEEGRRRPSSGMGAAERRPDPDTLELLSATSGTTGGLTKLVARTQNQYFSLQRHILSRHGIGEDDVILGLPPITQAIGSNPIYANLLFGSSYVELERFDAAVALEVMADHGVTCLVSVPTHLIDLLDGMDRGCDLPALRLVYSTGTFVPPEVARAFEERTRATFISAYGAIDCGLGAASGPDDPPQKRFTTSGRLHEAEEVRVTDDSGRILPSGQTGEFRLRGPSGGLGYFADDHADEALFDPDRFARTGDLGFVDEDGYLHVVERAKDIIVRGGQNIVPAEVERALLRHPSVAHAAVVAAQDPRLGETCCAFIVARGDPPTLEAIRDHLRRQGLSGYKLPERMETLDELPMSAGGKVRKDLLRARLLHGPR